VNRAPLEMLLRVPGIGAKSAYRITEARRYTSLTFEHLKKMRVVLKRARHFITASGKFYGVENETALRGLLAAGETAKNAAQLSIFTDLQIARRETQFMLYSNAETARSALTGEL
ncbi:MAG: radical SAM protein, partial [Clostridia bacterium]|nr:radical SAM protein [Clostridia bacterium]